MSSKVTTSKRVRARNWTTTALPHIVCKKWGVKTRDPWDEYYSDEQHDTTDGG